jgi:hypothetical protein
MPADGGNPDAIETPRHKGKAIRNTRNPDCKSLRQLSFKPAKPVWGIAGRVVLFIVVLVYSVSLIDSRMVSLYYYIIVTQAANTAMAAGSAYIRQSAPRLKSRTYIP